MNQPMIYLVVGARPNFMKIAPVARALDRRKDHLEYQVIHTGQHYDREMSTVFFEELSIRPPDYHLDCGGGSHGEQTAKIMVAFERLCQSARPDCVVVVGDVNSTLACAIVAKKLQIRVAHIEAGLRSGDMSMPEEINRLVTDSICDWFFCTEPSGVEHLLREGKPSENIFHVGHVMIDNLFHQLAQLDGSDPSAFLSRPIKQSYPQYGVVTLHRPSNVDDESTLKGLMHAFSEIAKSLPLIFPVHPRTRERLETFGIVPGHGLVLTPPMSYMDFLNLWRDAALVLTDSGGLQEETTALLRPCLTLRENSERPITLTEGTNILAGTCPAHIVEEARKVLSRGGKSGRRPELWDGHAAERIATHLEQLLYP